MKQPVIMQLIPELSAGGAEQGCLDIAEALVKSEAHAIVVSNGGKRVYELERMGAEHISLPIHSKNPFQIYKNAGVLAQIIKDKKVDIVHARSRAPAWAAIKACKKTGAAFMTTCHAPYNFKGSMKRYYNSVMAKGERVVAISHFIADYLRTHYKINDEQIRVVPNGIKIEKFHPKMLGPHKMLTLMKEWRIPDDARIILLPGRLTRWKGHHILIEAMSHINESDVCCVIIGDDQGRSAYRRELEELVERYNLGGRVRVMNHCDDMPAAYMMSEVVVSASIEPEGFGRVPVEAQAMGCPVIATDHGGARETIFDGETGWLVEPDNAHALAEAIKNALALTPHQKAVMGTKAMANVARNFSRELMIDRTLDVYAELLQARADPQAFSSAMPQDGDTQVAGRG